MLVFLNGCFDILHVGHIRLFEFAYEHGNVFVGLNSDESVKKIKGNDRPIFCQEDRKEILMSIKYIYDVMIFNELTPKKLIETLNPDIIIVGYDHSIEDKCYNHARKVNKVIIQAPQFGKVSTSLIIKKQES